MSILVLAAAFVSLVMLTALALVERRRRATLADLTVAREAAATLRDNIWRLEAAAAARDRAEAANEAKSRFLATVSHEVRTPLAGIIGTAELLAALPLDAEATSYVGAIRTCGTALSSLIDEILDFSRIEAGKLELADETFDPVALVEGVVELLSPRAHGQGLSIACLIAPQAARPMRGDPARVRQILLNLAGNAIKFTREGGVGIRVSQTGDGRVRFAVSDTGPGIASEHRRAIFAEFERGDASDASGGVGLGLAISRGLTERMDGTLSLEHTSAAGSTFVLSLPLRPDDAAGLAQAAPILEGSKHVLLLAAAAFEADFLAERLRQYGVQVELVATEDRALEKLRSSPFDLAIVDCAVGEAPAGRIAQAAHDMNVPRTFVLLAPFERRALAPATWRAFDGWLIKPVREQSLRRCFQPRSLPAARAESHHDAEHILEGSRVLLAEDDDVNALIATRALQRAGAQVTRVCDGRDAIDALERGGSRFDAVLMDIRMPTLDGHATARLLRSHPSHALRHLPLVALSANAFAEDRHAALAAGFDMFLTKPVPLEQLTRAVADCIEARANLRAA